MRTLLLLIPLLLSTGCASYEYDLVKPQPMHIGEKPHTFLDQPPVKYEMVTSDSQLVMLIHNPTDQTLTLRADKSYVIDQGGASRAVRGMAIAPQSHVKFIFPPPKPYVQDEGPRFGVGIGGFDGGGAVGGVGVGSGGSGSVRNLDENYYWDWDGQGQVRFHFVFSDNQQTYEHDLVIDRKKK